MADSDVQRRVDEIMGKARQAAAVFTQLDQVQTDRIVRAVHKAGLNNRVKLAKLAHDETGIGIWEHKVLKNVIAAQLVYDDIKDEKTVGVIREDHNSDTVEIAQPLGPILAIIPMTNPTSTILFKILLAMKTRNPIIISPHRKALGCCAETARLCYEAALSEDAPEDCIQWITESSREQTQAFMGHKDLALILATGGGGLVKAAYSSGTPAIGVGAGNVPVCIEKSADIPFAVSQVFDSKTFDNGTVCASEQAIVIEKAIAKEVIEELKRQGGYFLSTSEIDRVADTVFDKEKKLMRAEIVGKSALYIAEKAGVAVPGGTRVLIAEQAGVGEKYPLSSEVLAPIMALYVVDDFESATNLCLDLNYYGGVGHTVSIFSNDESRILLFASMMNAGRIVVNMPSSQGAVGGIVSGLHPSFTLGCGTGGKNITTDNVTARHLLNIQRIARRHTNEKWARMDKKILFDESVSAEEMTKQYHKNF